MWLCLRRRKKEVQIPQHGVATFNPSQPPVGVGGYTDAKPHFQPAQPTYYPPSVQPSPHTQQAYPQQGGFSPPPLSPASPHGFQFNNNATPSPAYTNNVKYDVNGAAELGGGSNGSAPALPGPLGTPQPAAAPVAHVAELDGPDVISRPSDKR